MQSIRFQGLYDVRLQGFRVDNPLNREKLETSLQQISRNFQVPIQINYEHSVSDRVAFSHKGEREARAQLTTESAQVNIPTSHDVKKTAKRELPSLEELDIYNEHPPKNADEAFERFLQEEKVVYRRLL